MCNNLIITKRSKIAAKVKKKLKQTKYWPNFKPQQYYNILSAIMNIACSTCLESFTGKSLSEAFIFESTNPKYDDRLFIELQVQYMKIPSSEHGGENVVYTNCFLFLLWHSEQFMYTTCSEHVLSLQFSCIKLVIQWTICRHILG